MQKFMLFFMHKQVRQKTKNREMYYFIKCLNKKVELVCGGHSYKYSSTFESGCITFINLSKYLFHKRFDAYLYSKRNRENS